MERFMIRRSAKRGSERGQMLPLIALSAAVLIAMVGLGIDLGFAYMTKARLSKACDAAALAGMENINQGTVTAKQVAFAEFYANYANGALKTSLDTATVTPTFTFSPSSSAATQLTVTAKTSIQTFFVKVLSSLGDSPWKTEVVGDSSVVSRGLLDFTLVLDKSSSLDYTRNNGNNGRAEMYPAVTNFLSFFSDTLDKGALETFSTFAQYNVALGSPFQANIGTVTSSIYISGNGFGGYTDGADGLSNAMVVEEAVRQPNSSNLVKAVIFFTDGHMNTIQNNLTCTPASLAFTAGDPPQTNINFYAVSNGSYEGCKVGTGCNYCLATSNFPSLHGPGGVLPFDVSDVRQEAEDRCISYASQMRDNGIVVCAIGLGIGTDGPDVPFMQIVANDPSQPQLTPTPYDGIYVPATNSTDMAAAFQRVAENLLLRLVH